MIGRVEAIEADIAEFQERIDEHPAPFAGDTVEQLDEIPDVGVTAARAVIAEIGLDMAQFPSPEAPKAAGPITYDTEAYKRRNVVERSFNVFKQRRALATRYDKLALTYRGGGVLRAITISLKALQAHEEPARAASPIR